MDRRNLAIIAHVDHGKTTLVDKLLAQSGTFRANQQVAERAMDSNDLERERGITILAKCTSVVWKDVRINIVDTPGHADFGGEVERILSMVDGVLVLVDAAEGPMPQTKFVVGKALRQGLCPIVVINKIDRPDARAREVHNEIFDLFAALDASEAQLDFPTVFASGRNGWATAELDGPRKDLSPLFELIIAHVQPPVADAEAPFSMLATTLDYDPYLGRVLTGLIHSGVARINMPVKSLSRDGRVIEQARLTKLQAFRGLDRRPIEEARSGDIIAVAGLGLTTVADTICAPEVMTALPADPIDPPTLAMTFSVNDSPLAGRDGSKVTSGGGKLRLTFEAATRGLIGYHGEFLTDTRGSGVMSRLFHGYAPYKGPIEGRRNGVLISNAQGAAVAYALWNLEERGPMFITPGAEVYPGMIIGAHSRGNDLDVNPRKGKQLTNIRTTAKDEAVRLTPPMQMSLEEAIAYIADDELVEVTPKAIRLRKRLLDVNDRRRANRAAAAE